MTEDDTLREFMIWTLIAVLVLGASSWIAFLGYNIIILLQAR